MSASGRFVALLRGINVGGARKLPMAELRALFEAAGAREVRSYIQSGNVVFETSEGGGGGSRRRDEDLVRSAAESVAAHVAATLAKRFGGAVPAVLRSAAELDAAIEAMPFDVTSDEPKFFSIGFLDGTPAPKHVAALDPQRSPPDRFEVRGRELYLHYPDGSAGSKLSHAWFAKELGIACTVRNWNTVRRLQEMCRA